MDNKVPQQINDIVGDNVKKLAQLFPSAVKDGEVDFEALKEELGQYEEVGSEKYELTWAGKKNAKKIAQEDVIGRTLKFIPEDSKDADTTENLYIEGDNLEVLKLIRQNYYGAIKIIYIDPPYNTGNDFIYNDHFEMDKDDSDKEEGTMSEEGQPLMLNSKSYNRFHANWLNMLYPRLKIAKELLKEDGLIFISIDDNEVEQLKCICNEIYGEENFVAMICVETSNGVFGLKAKHAKTTIVKSKDYVVVYANNVEKVSFTPLYSKSKKYFDTHFTFYKKENFECQLNDFLSSNETLNKYAQILGVSNNITNLSLMMEVFPEVNDFIKSEANNIYRIRDYTLKIEDNIKLSKDTKQLINGNYVFLGNNNKPVYLYPFAQLINKTDDYNSEMCSSVIVGDLWKGFNEDMGNVGKEGEIKYDNGKKPVRLVKNILKIIDDKEAIVLDFFSGSATTAHAVMKLNSEDGGSRKYICVQLEENLDETLEKVSGETKKSLKQMIEVLDLINKRHILSEVGKERIRRSGEKIQATNNANIDIGFKVFRTADTNIKWNSLMDMGQVDMKQLEYTPDLVDFMPDANDVDVVYELMLRQRDVALSETLEQLSDIGRGTYLYASSYLVCLETQITEELVGKLAELDPLPIKFIFRDSAFKDDIALKDETFRRLKALIEKNAGTNKPTYTVEFI